MREIDDDLSTYLDAGSIMSQMNTAFGGNTTDIIALTEPKSKKKESKGKI